MSISIVHTDGSLSEWALFSTKTNNTFLFNQVDILLRRVEAGSLIILDEDFADFCVATWIDGVLTRIDKEK